MKLDHIGYAVKNMDKALSSFVALGYEVCGDETEDIERKVRIQFLIDADGSKVELISPLSEDSPVSHG